MFISIDREGRGECRFDYLAEAVAPLANVSTDAIIAQLKRIVGQKKDLVGFEDFLVWHVMNMRSDHPVELAKIQLSMLGPSFVFSTYLHEQESMAERAEELRHARPQGSAVSHLFRGEMPTMSTSSSGAAAASALETLRVPSNSNPSPPPGKQSSTAIGLALPAPAANGPRRISYI